jgi:hypothetical protein
VHSGLYGGPVPDALTALCRMLACLHDERGDVAVPGLVRRRRLPSRLGAQAAPAPQAPDGLLLPILPVVPGG